MRRCREQRSRFFLEHRILVLNDLMHDISSLDVKVMVIWSRICQDSMPFCRGLGFRVLLKGRISCWWTMLVRDALVAQGGYEVNPWVKRCSLQRQVTQQMSKPVHIDIRVTNAFL